MIITVFGSSEPTKKGYQEAYKLGEKIGSLGYTLQNGAYGGTMEACAKGCQKSGGKVIGVGVKGHQIDKMKEPNDFNSEVIECENIFKRIQRMLECDLIVVLRGSIGTLEELFAAWIHAMEHKAPKILIVGEEMIALLDFLINNNFLRKEHFVFVEKVSNISGINKYLD